MISYLPMVKKSSSLQPPTLTNRYSHIHLDQDSYKVLLQARTKKTPYSGQGTHSLTSPGYWELRREAALMNARGKWEDANQRSAPTEPTLPWLSTRELNSGEGKEQREALIGTVLGKPVGVVLSSKEALITARDSSEPVAKPLLRQLDTLIAPIKTWASFDSATSGALAYGGGSGAEAGYGFGALKAVRQTLGKPLAALAAFAFIIMFFFSLMYWVSQSIGVYVPNASFNWIDYFWFSVRSFVTMSSPDMGPTSSWGRMLTNVEGLLGMIFIIMLSLFLGEKFKKFLDSLG